MIVPRPIALCRTANMPRAASPCSSSSWSVVLCRRGSAPWAFSFSCHDGVLLLGMSVSVVRLRRRRFPASPPVLIPSPLGVTFFAYSLVTVNGGGFFSLIAAFPVRSFFSSSRRFRFVGGSLCTLGRFSLLSSKFGLGSGLCLVLLLHLVLRLFCFRCRMAHCHWVRVRLRVLHSRQAWLSCFPP